MSYNKAMAVLGVTMYATLFSVASFVAVAYFAPEIVPTVGQRLLHGADAVPMTAAELDWYSGRTKAGPDGRRPDDVGIDQAISLY